MINALEAESIIANTRLTLSDEEVTIEEAMGRVVKENILADRDLPPFDRVMMDGVAIRTEDWYDGNREFKSEGIQTAGSPQKKMNDSGSCIEVMTGAVLPESTDAVIRYEDTKEVEGTFHITTDTIQRLQNIHTKGTDRKKNEVLISSGTVLTPAEIAIMATVGKKKVKVAAMPKIAIVSTGDELVEIDETPSPYQIRRSNAYALRSALAQVGVGHVSLFHFNDEKKELLIQLKEVIRKNDVLILSGGVSRGKKDYVPEVLDELGVQKQFHKVAQRPGKPFWFGGIENKKVVFALPGNPISTFMCCYQYVIPWVKGTMGLGQTKSTAILTQDFSFEPELEYFLQVKATNENGKLMAKPVAGKGSGDLANLLETNAFLRLPAHKKHFKAGEAYPLIPFKKL